MVGDFPEGRMRLITLLPPSCSMTSVSSQDGRSPISEIGIFVACHAILMSEMEERLPLAAFCKKRIGGAMRKAVPAHRNMAMDGGMLNTDSSGENGGSGKNAQVGNAIVTRIRPFTSAPP